MTSKLYLLVFLFMLMLLFSIILNINESYQNTTNLTRNKRIGLKKLRKAQISEIETLKREYYASEPKNPNVLLQIQELEREANGILPSDNNNLHQQQSQPYLNATHPQQPNNMNMMNNISNTKNILNKITRKLQLIIL